jgi:hypothetical protein
MSSTTIKTPIENASIEFARALAPVLGRRRMIRLRRVMRLTGLPPEVLLDVALELLEISAQKLAPPPIRRTAMALGAARWRNVSPEERSEQLRRAVKARWAKARSKNQKEDT